MTPRRILSFFSQLDRRLNRIAEVIVVGASAGALMGHIRPSVDIDFEIRCRGKKFSRQQLAAAIEETARISGVAVNYSENIGGWSMISYLNYRKTSVFFRQIGKIKLKLIAPEYWTIGKMARFLELDIQDMIKIIRRKKLTAHALIKVWSAAVNASDLSLELGQFRDHVVYFLKHYTHRLWGKKTDADQLTRLFLKTIQNET